MGRLRLVEGSARAVVERACRRRDRRQVYWFDPGDMRTEMHQAAFPGEDISDRPLPETVVPGIPAPARYVALERQVPCRELLEATP